MSPTGSTQSRRTRTRSPSSNPNSSSTRRVRARVSTTSSTARQIQYNNSLPRMGSPVPVSANREWSFKEDNKLLAGVWKHGKNWTVIATLLPGRTANAVKNRYAALLKINRKLMKMSFKTKKRAGEEDAKRGDPRPGEMYWDKKARKWKVVNKTNVKGYYKQNFTNAEAAKHIKKHKRVYLDVDLRNGKVQHVYDIDGIIHLLVHGGLMAKSPLTRKNFRIEQVQPF